ncbi:MAG: hypothetical protein K0R30_1707 [Ornithinibacter sp.]|jgi:hypothetical protein|nr:hypothetical protein [Ornithinibacter sp.]
MSAANPTADSTTTGAATATTQPPSISALEAEITVRRERLANTIDELTHRVTPRNILHRRTQAAKARFADVATTPEGHLRVERLAAVVAVVAVVGGVILYRRIRQR